LLPLGFAWLAAAAFAGSLGFFVYSYFVRYGAVVPSAGPLSMALLSSPALVNYLLFTVFALHHSLFARPAVKALLHRVVQPRLERAVYTLLASGLFVLACWWWQPVGGVAWRLTGAWRWVGYAVQAAGVAVTVVGARALDVLELAGVRQLTPRRGPPPPLKVDGVYGFVRHPLYFAWMLLVFGAPDMTMTRLSFALISTVYLAVAIPFEERSLIETFGPAYASYRKKVRWRMLPGVW
jgi:protein-S-isoprenylcysteine O-methyltransferase Ste14